MIRRLAITAVVIAGAGVGVVWFAPDTSNDTDAGAPAINDTERAVSAITRDGFDPVPRFSEPSPTEPPTSVEMWEVPVAAVGASDDARLFLLQANLHLAETDTFVVTVTRYDDIEGAAEDTHISLASGAFLVSQWVIYEKMADLLAHLAEVGTKLA